MSAYGLRPKPTYVNRSDVYAITEHRLVNMSRRFRKMR